MSIQEGLEDSCYYDIMVIGRTGMGKSTTVDKLLIAKLPGIEHPVPEPSPVDLTMWLVSDEEFEVDGVAARLKILTYFSSCDDPHKDINKSRKYKASVTDQCELLSNETTKIRILDVPGFFGRGASGEARDLDERALAAKNKDLGMMRKVLRIKSVHRLGFNRVIYFLPDKGCPTRTSHNLIMEIAIMEKHFGRAIFDNMVVVATMPAEVYECVDESSNLFPDGKLEESKIHLQEAIREIFRGCDDVPEPPIIFISLFDTCERILEKVQGARVKHDQIQLELSKSLCSRCGVTIVKEGKKEANVAYCTASNQSGKIPDEESTCHPMLIPKHSKVVKVLGGIAHLITLHRFKGKWPSFATMDEVCLCCKMAPGSHGCMQIGSRFPVGEEEINVQHSTSVFESYEVVNEDGTPFDVGVRASGPEGLAPGSSCYIYPDRRVCFRRPQDASTSEGTCV